MRESAPPPEMSAQNLKPKARWMSRKRHQRFQPNLPAGMSCEAAMRAASSGIGGLEMGFEQGEDARHRGEDGDALAMDGFNEAGRDEAAIEVDLGAEDGRDPEAHGLAEDVAQRQGVEKAQGMDVFFVAHVALRGLLRWDRCWPARCRGCARCLWDRRWCRR